MNTTIKNNRNCSITTFEEAVAYLEDMPRFTVKKDPADPRDLRWFLKQLENPEQNLRIIHVAGTNGKGSVCAYMRSVLEAAGYRTAMFTSPHLVDMRERFVVDGKMISRDVFLQAFLDVYEKLGAVNAQNRALGNKNAVPEFILNFYEYLFCMALLYFAEEKPDYCIIETGLGGRLDATNYVDNKVLTVITRISLDHVQYLGDTTAKIAGEKAGILRPGVPVVYLDGDVQASAVICRNASELGVMQIPVSKKDYTFLGFRKKYIDFSLRSEYYNYISLTLHTIARYQMENAALAVRAVEVLFRSTDTEDACGRLCAGVGCPTQEEIRQGILGCFWQGRMEEVLPEVYVDGAHNDDGIRAFLDTVKEDGCTDGRRLLFGVAADKDCRHMIQRVITSGLFDRIAFTHMRTARSASLEALRELLAAYPEDQFTMYTEADTALRTEISGRRPGERLYIAGSLYLVGEIKESLDHDQF